MSDKANQEFSLDQFSETETDEEFGLPEFKEHFADTLTPAVLRDWTAKDFASIYVRFRPHLERHARRFLVNPHQVEEVVQDAFLYLMTTLPELDSELGVLKFLKWKVRLISLDVIRANSKSQLASLEDFPELTSNQPEISEQLERADDAALVSLALSKLQPRQREALISTVYEEKSKAQVAAQMGLSENAFRQLLFRARAALKHELVGEFATAGKPLSEIMSLAARKALSHRVIGGAAVVAFLLSSGLMANYSSQEADGVDFAATRNVDIDSRDYPPPSLRHAGVNGHDDPSPQSPESNLEDSIRGTREAATAVATSKTLDTNSVELGPREETNEQAVFSDYSDVIAGELVMTNLLDNTLPLESQSLEMIASTEDCNSVCHFRAHTEFSEMVFSVSILGEAVLISSELPDLGLAITAKTTVLKITPLDNGEIVDVVGTDFLLGDTFGDFQFASTSKSIFSNFVFQAQLLLKGDQLSLNSGYFLEKNTARNRNG